MSTSFINTGTNKMLRLIFAAFLGLGIVNGSALAGPSQIKSFEFGPGTQNSQSAHRRFAVPCGVGIDGVVQYRRTGPSGAANDIPLVIEVRHPGANDQVDGPIVAQFTLDQDRYKAATTQRSFRIGPVGPSDSDCSVRWRVRVRPLNGQALFAVFGHIVVSPFAFSDMIDVEGGGITLNKGNEVTKKVGSSEGLREGKVKITATWLHSFFGVPDPLLQVPLEFELINPNGRVVATKKATSNKLNLTFNVRECTPGQWKLRIKNNSNDDVMDINPKVVHSSACVN